MIKIDLTKEHPHVLKQFVEMLDREADGTVQTIESGPLKCEEHAHWLLFLIRLRRQFDETAA